MSTRILFFLLSLTCLCQGQIPEWQLWADGLPTGVYPRMAVAPNHDIFYTLLGAGTNLGYIYQANTQDTVGDFTALPLIPRPVTIQNNIVALGYNQWSEPLAGIYRSDVNEPWLFRYDRFEQRWDTASSPANPTLGGHCIATAENGIIYVGTRWANIYKSTDDGRTFEIINETNAVRAAYPCYYPSWIGSEYDGAIFGLQVDRNGRVYAGTESAGVIYSDDEGAHWHPADFYACLASDNHVKDSNSVMRALSMSGNVAGLGFTKDNQLVWSGADMWTLGWKNKIGFADLDAHTVSEVQGLPDYLVQAGQQVSRIVTTDNGQLFFHSGGSVGTSGIGIYTSWDGIHWSLFNDGITGANDGLSQGSLAVDGNKVFMATHDGKVWMYEDTTAITGVHPLPTKEDKLQVFPNPVTNELHINWPVDSSPGILDIEIYSGDGQLTLKEHHTIIQVIKINVSAWKPGVYLLCTKDENGQSWTATWVKL